MFSSAFLVVGGRSLSSIILFFLDMNIIVLSIFCWGKYYNEKQVEKRDASILKLSLLCQKESYMVQQKINNLNWAPNCFLLKPFHYLIKALLCCDWSNYEVPLSKQYITGYMTIVQISEYSATVAIISCPGSLLTSHLERWSLQTIIP